MFNLKFKKKFINFQFVLFLGNFINFKTPRGNAFGIRIETLKKVLLIPPRFPRLFRFLSFLCFIFFAFFRPQLSDTKTVDGKLNLFHYIVSFFIEKQPHFLNVVEELKEVPEAAKGDERKMKKEEEEKKNKL
jgi:hypothetical protein